MESLAQLYKNLRSTILEGKQVGTVYHFTKWPSLFSILEQNHLKARLPYDPLMLRSTPLNYKGPTISTTRDKAFSSSRHKLTGRGPYIQGSSVALQLDGDKLSTVYKVTPVDDRYDPFTKNIDLINKVPMGDEMEEVWYGKKLAADKGFKNLKKYIKGIIVDGTWYEEYATTFNPNSSVTSKKEINQDFIKVSTYYRKNLSPRLTDSVFYWGERLFNLDPIPPPSFWDSELSPRWYPDFLLVGLTEEQVEQQIEFKKAVKQYMRKLFRQIEQYCGAPMSIE